MKNKLVKIGIFHRKKRPQAVSFNSLIRFGSWAASYASLT